MDLAYETPLVVLVLTTPFVPRTTAVRDGKITKDTPFVPGSLAARRCERQRSAFAILGGPCGGFKKL
jgi:hypothetical protein